MGCLHRQCLALRRIAAGDPTVLSRVTPASRRAPAEASTLARSGVVCVLCMLSGDTIGKHFEQLVARELLEGSR